MKRQPLLVVLIAAGFGVASAAAPALEPGWYDDRSIQTADGARYFRYYVPERLSAARPPVVFFLHGGLGSMRDAMPPAELGSAHWPETADEHGFVLVVPNGVDRRTGDAFGDNQQWNDCREDPEDAIIVDDVAFLQALMDWTVESLGVDPARVYFTGSSNGGMMTLRMATEAPERVAAAAPFIANQPAEGQCGEPTRAVPMLIVNGTADPLMPYDGGEVANSGTNVMSTAETVDLWRATNATDGGPRSTLRPDLDPADGSTVEQVDYAATRTGAGVRLLRMVGAGHAMPSRSRLLNAQAEAVVGPQNHDIEGADEAWSFLSRFAAGPATAEGQWVNADPAFRGAGEGLTFDYLRSAGVLFVAWFTHAADPDAGTGSGAGGVGAPGQRWLTAQLTVSGDRASGPLFSTAGGEFDAPAAPGQSTDEVGSMTIDLGACDHGIVEYELDDPALEGGFAIQPLEVRAAGRFKCRSGFD